eukprot:TRINITY_DN121942_c0_g1_i1.p1 TRINITY_DN121942_c0_g1~~TRINITY_DN121942_c0_g1_i1.p1  ORF type:complete len:498 (+),score=87.14 TRINITY_DN121942_c0_g1_i1:53-1546(+)
MVEVVPRVADEWPRSLEIACDRRRSFLSRAAGTVVLWVAYAALAAGPSLSGPSGGLNFVGPRRSLQPSSSQASKWRLCQHRSSLCKAAKSARSVGRGRSLAAVPDGYTGPTGVATEAAPRRPRIGDNLEKAHRQAADEGRSAVDGGTRVPLGHQTWTDYTRYALGIEDYGPGSDPNTDQSRVSGKAGQQTPFWLERNRALGVDFGPEFTGLALSLGGVNTMPMGILQTAEDWASVTLRIVQIASTRRVRDIVVGFPLEKDGTEGKIAKLVRHFSQMLADSALLVLGPNCTVHLWDERFSTTYAAMRLVTRPKFDSAAFKTWLDGQKGLAFGAKSLLDAEAARAILEHWLERDPETEQINKERSERVMPSREACMAYLKWKKRPLLKARRPREPAGPGKEGWEFDDQNPGSNNLTPEEYMAQTEKFNKYMDASDHFGDRWYEYQARKEERKEERKLDQLRAEQRDLTPIKTRFRERGIKVEEKHRGIGDRLRKPEDAS